MSEPPKRKRRWFQFSLRSLLIFTAIVALGCGWLGRRMEQKRREREVIKAIENMYGRVEYDYESEEREGKLEPSGPSWLRSMFGVNFFSEANVVDLEGSDIGDAQCAILKDLPHLKSLRLCAPQLTDSGPADLQSCMQLETLFIRQASISDAGLKHPKELYRLRHVYLGSVDVSDAGIADLQRALPNCEIGH